jgi:hypothetical protein
MGKKTSFKGKRQYAAYGAEDRVTKNRIARLERAVKAQPNDMQAVAALKALKDGKSGRRRKTPFTKGGWCDRNKFPFSTLSDKEQPFPTNEGGFAVNTFNQYDFVMNKGLKARKKFAQMASACRYPETGYNTMMKEVKAKQKAGYAF